MLIVALFGMLLPVLFTTGCEGTPEPEAPATEEGGEEAAPAEDK